MIDRPEGGERAVLVYLHLRGIKQPTDYQEFRELALSAGADLLGDLTSSHIIPNARYFLGKGKVEELKALVEALSAELVLVDHSLTPAQERNLERALGCRVVDRTGLILDIFAQRARSYEGKLQVELAQLKHLASRLVRGWTHLERQKGGIGLRGPGETQLEVDRRLIRGRIKHLQARLEKLRSQRRISRQARQSADFPTVSLVGYTNVGKSTLFNALTGAQAWVANQLFATLDPTLRAIELPPLGKVILADTVGFVSNLPHDLVEAFRATLEEVKEAALLLHVIDAQDELREARIKQVEAVLEIIGALALPRIEVYNKVDLLPEAEPHIERDGEGRVRRVFVSAETGAGLELLKAAILECLERDIIQGELRLAPEQARLRAYLYEIGAVLKERREGDFGICVLQLALPQQRWQRLCLENPGLENCWQLKA